MIYDLLLLLFGFGLLVLGGEFLVRGSVRIAERLGVSPLVIGLTLVGFGTSTPELVTSVQAALAGSPGIAFGNIVGSNIANILLIVGLSSILCPIIVSSVALKRDGLTMLGVAIIFAALAATLPFGRIVGACLVAALAIYIYMAFRQEQSPSTDDHGAVFDKSQALQDVDTAVVPAPTPKSSLGISLLTAVAGLGLVILGGSVLVENAVSLAKSLGISETVIGLTIVALGTSMPELVTSVIAAFRRQGDLAFGNIVGSNIYNLLGIGGMTALIAPSSVPTEIVTFDNLVMIAVSALLVIVAYTGLKIARWEGCVLLTGYVGYVFLTLRV